MDSAILRKIYASHIKQGCFMKWQEWNDLVEKAYSVLVDRAKTKPYREIAITYGELGSKIGLYPLSDWFHLKIGWIVGACSEYEYEFDRPLISALVVNSETYQSGKGFWGLPGIPADLQKKVKIEDSTPLKLTGDRDKFWINQLKEIDLHWKSAA